MPVDGTPGGSLPLSVAVPIARAGQTKLVLLRVSVSSAESAVRYVADFAGRLRRLGLAAEGRSVRGRPAEVITSIADEIDADLIAMSTHARGGPLRSLLGSVADEVVREARRPVLLVRRAAPQQVRTSS